MKLSKKWNKFITLFLLATIGMSTTVVPIISSPILIHADEIEEKTDDEKEDTSSGSAGITNPIVRKNYINRSSYDFSTHYATVRAYLDGTFLNNTKYASLYTSGEKATANSTIAQNYLAHVEKIGQSDDQTDSQNANTSLSDADMEGSVDAKNLYSTKVREFASKFVDKLLPEINKTYQVNPEVKGNKFYLLGFLKLNFGTKYIISRESLNTLANKTSSPYDTQLKNATIDYIVNKLSSDITSSPVKSELESTITDSLINSMYYATYGGNMFVTKNSDGYSGYFDYNKNTPSYVSQYINYSNNVAPDGFANDTKFSIDFTVIDNRLSLRKNGEVFTVKSKTKEDADEQVRRASYFEGLFQFVKLPKSENKTQADAYNAKMKKTVKSLNSDIKELADILSKTNETISGKNPLLTYTPMEIGITDNVDTFNLKNYKKVISDAGQLTLGEKEEVQGKSFTQILDMDGEKRALQVQDLILNGKGKTTSQIMTGDTLKVRGTTYIKSDGDAPLISKKGMLNEYIGVYYGRNSSSKKSVLTAGDFESGLSNTLSNVDLKPGMVLYKAITASRKFNKIAVGTLNAEDSIIATAMDNYGNLIATETGAIVIPSWQNDLFVSQNEPISANVALKSGGNKYLSNAILNNSDLFNLGSVRKKAIEKAKKSDEIKNSKNLINEFNNFITPDNTMLESAFYEKIASNSISSDELDLLALMITLVTEDSVREYNAKYIEALNGNATFYVYPTATGFMSQEDYDDMKLARWTASSLIQKIGFLIDFGIFEVIRLTIAQIAVNLYDSIVTWAGNVFYNDNITETYTWKNIINALATLMFAFMILYLGYVAYGIFTKRVTLKDVIKKTLFLILVIFIPYSGYNMITNAIINKPSELVLNNIVKQSMVVNFLEDKQSNKQIASDEMKQAYEELFGSNKANNEFTTKNYMLTFYTTTNRDGIDVTDLKSVEQSENGWFKSNTKTLNTLTNQYNKNKLVPVKASMFDLYVWSTNRVYAREGIPKELESYYENNEDASKQIKDETFFSYLERVYDAKYKDKSPYIGLSKYKEYEIDMSMLYDNDVLKQGVFKDNINRTSLGKITASDLFYELQKNSLNSTNIKNPKSALQDGLNDLVNIINLFSIDYNYTKNSEDSDGRDVYIPTSDDYDELIRDFSMVKSTRKQAYGKSDALNYSDFTLSVLGKSDKFNIPTEAKQTYAPKEDYFGVYTTISDLMKSQNEISNARYKNAQETTYKVVSQTLATVASKYANIGKILNVNTNDIYTNSALQMSVLMELYFNLVKELGMTNFPHTYEPDSISFDSLLKQIYIPLSQYDFQSYTASDLLVTNLIEYITLTENSFFVILVFIAIILVFAFWMIYWFVFKFLMLIVVMYKFVKEYLILGNYSNKSWLGSLYIYATMGLVRLGLAVIWWLGYSIINSAFANYGGLIYNIAFVHSLAIIVYIIFAIKKVFIPLLKAVLEDKENLGANSITSKLETIKGNLSMKGLAMKGAKGLANSAGRNLRRGKNIGRGTSNVIKKLVSKVGGNSVKVARFVGDRKAVRDMKSKISNGAENALRNRGAFSNAVADKIFSDTKKAFSEEEKLIKKSQGNSIKNSFAKFQLLKNINKQDKLAKKMATPMKFGDIINLANGATKLGATMVEMSNIPQNILVNHGSDLLSYLAKQGIQAKIFDGKDENGVDIKKLAIDTTAYDMHTEEGREASVIDIQNFAKQKIIESNRKFVSGDVSELNSFNYDLPLYSLDNNNNILLDTTLSNGIDYNTIDSVFYKGTLSVQGFEEELKSIKNKFNFEPVTWTDANGKEVVSQTKFKMIPKSGVSQSEITQSMKELKKIDDSVRTRFNKPLMNTSEDKNLKYELFKFTDSEKEYLFKEFVEKSGISYIVDSNGTGRIIYDENIKSSRNAVNTFKDVIKQAQKENKKDFKELDTSLGAYASKGDGYGTIETSLYDSRTNSNEINRVFGQGTASNNAYVVALDKNNDENSKKMHNALVVASATSKLANTENFKRAIDTKDKNRKIIKDGLKVAMNNDNNLLKDSLDYIKDNDNRLASSDIFKSLSNDYQKYTHDLESGNISKEKYDDIMPFLTNQATELLENSSLIEGFTGKVDFEKAGSSITNKERDKLIKDIVSSKEEIKNALSLKDIKDVDRNNIDSNYVERVSTLFGEKGEVIYNKFNNTVVVKTDKEIEASNGNITDALMYNEYSKLLNTKVDNDSPLINKYMEAMPRYKETPKEIQKIISKETKNGDLDLDDLFKEEKPNVNKKATIVTPEPQVNIQKSFDKTYTSAQKRLANLNDIYKTSLINGKGFTPEQKSEFDRLSKNLRKINLERESMGILENDAKLIEMNSRLKDLNKEMDNFKNSL